MDQPDAVSSRYGRSSSPQPGDILLFYNAGGLSKLISWFTKSRYYHVALYAGDDWVVEARLRGVVRQSLDGDLDGSNFIIIPAPEGKGYEALRWAQQCLGDAYSVRDALGIFLDRLFTHREIDLTRFGKRFSCGELVARAYLNAGVKLFPDKSEDEVVPADFEILIDN